MVVTRAELLVAVLAGVVQGVVEWLPISSQGNLALVLTLVGTDPATALQLALFLQVGTTLSAVTYYRSELRDVAVTVPSWRPSRAFDDEGSSRVSRVVSRIPPFSRDPNPEPKVNDGTAGHRSAGRASPSFRTQNATSGRDAA